MSTLAAALRVLASGAALDRAQARAAFDDLIDHANDAAAVGGFLMALRARGETVEEIVAGAEALRARLAPFDAPPGVIDTCGTGGDGADTFNISTAAALIAAGAGAKVAKHGNRAVSSKSGSSDVLTALGVKLDPPRAALERCLAEAGVAFLFAPAHHPGVAQVAAARKALGVRTIFNLIGPLTNPAGARRQVLGVYAPALIEPMAAALGALGAERAWVVHGSDGLDELTTTGTSRVAEWRDGAVRLFDIAPEDAGLPRAKPEALKGADPATNAAALARLLDGEPGAYRDIAVLNAAAALVVADLEPDLNAAARACEAAIDSGAARTALDRLAAFSNEVGA